MDKESGLKRVSALVIKLLEKTNKQRHDYLKLIKLKEIKQLTEICMNILNGNIKITNKIKIILKRVCVIFYKLASRTTSFKEKKKLWSGLKGLHILNIILPILYNEVLLLD